jgi:hypothetical protein
MQHSNHGSIRSEINNAKSRDCNGVNTLCTRTEPKKFQLPRTERTNLLEINSVPNAGTCLSIDIPFSNRKNTTPI